MAAGLFPAHAGVIPDVAQSLQEQKAFPRPRGGDPQYVDAINAGKFFSPPTRG